MKKVSINNIDDVIMFFEYINSMFEVWHPDDSFMEYVTNKKDGITKREAEYLDNIMDKCFTVCNKYNKDIYNIAYEIAFK